jgi:uncharacterized RDD family membrane protein YckC
VDDTGTVQPDDYPGASLGLPPTGPGSLAGWGSRVAALVVDWGASMGVAVLLFGTGVLTGGGWRAWMILAVFFVESTVLTALAGGSFGKILARIGVLGIDGSPIGWGRSAARALAVCLVLPAVVIGAERRSLADLMLATVVLRRR